MCDEDLDRNPFWRALNSREQADLFASVASNKLTVCVPIAASMPSHVVVDKYYLESHILEASPFFAGEYMSANKKSVELRTGAISTKRGYPEKRTVRVVGEEAFYASEPEPFRVLFVDAPLEGPALAVEAPIELPASRRADDISAFLLQTAENKLVLNKLQREIDEFNQTYILVAGFEDAAVERVRAICDRTLEQLVCANPDLRKLYNGSDRQLAALSSVVDSYCLGQLHAKLFSGLRAIHATADAAARRRARRLALAPPSAVGVTVEVNESAVQRAVAQLQQIDAYVSPLAKLELLSQVQQIVAGDDEALSNDELLPLMVLVTVRSDPRHLSSTLAYITLFGHAETMPPHLSFQLTTLHAIYELIRDSGDAGSVTASPTRDTSAASEASGEGAAIATPDWRASVKTVPKTMAEALARHTTPAAPDPATQSPTVNDDVDESKSTSSAAADESARATARASPPRESTQKKALPLFIRAPDVIHLEDDNETVGLPKLDDSKRSSSRDHGLGQFVNGLRGGGNDKPR